MGKLSIVSTPIGNLEDITVRAIKTLFHADVILCEDTRRSGLLLHELALRYGEQFDQHPDWKPKLIPYYDEIEEKKLPEIIGLLEEGNDVALISDAGTPLISDPGFRLVRECLKRNYQVESIPGASAILAGLTSSGLPADMFLFLGYPPEKQTARISLLERIKKLNALDIHLAPTLVFYCAPHKLKTTLEDVNGVFGDIQIVLARELTKIHEQMWKGTVAQAMEDFSDPKGEFVLLFRI